MYYASFPTSFGHFIGFGMSKLKAFEALQKGWGHLVSQYPKAYSPTYVTDYEEEIEYAQFELDDCLMDTQVMELPDRRKELGEMYERVVGYNPFEDDPDIATIPQIIAIMKEYDDEQKGDFFYKLGAYARKESVSRTSGKSMAKVTFETPPFTFEAYGSTGTEAMAALMAAWAAHAKEYGAQPYYLEEHKDEVVTTYIQAGVCYRDNQAVRIG